MKLTLDQVQQALFGGVLLRVWSKGRSNPTLRIEYRPTWVNVRVRLGPSAISRAFRFYGGAASRHTVETAILRYLQQKMQPGSASAAVRRMAEEFYEVLLPHRDVRPLLSAAEEVDRDVRKLLTTILEEEDWSAGRSIEDGIVRLAARWKMAEARATAAEDLLTYATSQEQVLTVADEEPVPPALAYACRVLQAVFRGQPDAKNFVSFGWTDRVRSESYVVEVHRAEGLSAAAMVKQLQTEVDALRKAVAMRDPHHPLNRVALPWEAPVANEDFVAPGWTHGRVRHDLAGNEVAYAGKNLGTPTYGCPGIPDDIGDREGGEADADRDLLAAGWTLR
jgi:hypothetical protein